MATRIAALRDERFRAMHMSADETKAEMSNIGRFSLKGILKVSADGGPEIDLENMTDEQYAAISEISLSDDGKLKIKTHSKVAALGHMAKIHGLLKDQVVHSVDENYAAVMEQAQRRARERGRDE